MSSEEGVEARQNNEFEALHAIYGDDLKDLRSKPAWKKWSPLDLSISLTPQQGSFGTQEMYVKTDLHVICSDNYPDSPPKISLENNKGLSFATLVQLQEELELKANEFQGEEMIFQLTQHVQEFLHRHNKPTSKSFYDEMLKRQKEQEEKELLEENLQRQHMIEEVQRRHEILKSESKLRKERKFSNSENSFEDETEASRRTSLPHRKHNNSSTESSDESLCSHKGTVLINFGVREVQRGRCIKHSSPNHVVFTGIDNDNGELVVVCEWTIDVHSSSDLLHIQRQISSLEQEINYLTKLKHQNLAHYQSFKQDTLGNKVVVHLLKEYINGSNCSSLFLSQNFNIDIDFLKHIAKGVLQALDYLHRNNVVHKEIKDTCVYLNDKGIVKVNNYSIHKRLSDLLNPSHANYGKKTDIYNFGVFLLTLLKGSPITDENVEVPNSIPSDLYDFLSRCILKEEKERYTAAQLLNHSFFHKATVHFSPKHHIEEVGIQRNTSPEVIHTDLLVLSQSQFNGQSRVSNEFEFLQHLGKGAYGDVIKVKNKLDGGYYAIKRIQLNPKNKQLNKKIVREVKLLSRLNHENVVRYYNSWIETTTIKGEDSDLSSSSDAAILELDIPKIKRKDEFTVYDNIEAMAPPVKNVEVSITYDSKSLAVFDLSDNDSSSDDDSAWGPYDEDSESSYGVEFEHDISSESVLKETSSSIPFSKSQESPSQELPCKKTDFMYIQMEFCEKSTLRTAIDDNLYLDEDRLWRLFREIVEGLAHIHQQGMIHRDLKPVNIFLDFEDHVKIGDFGLATTNIKSRQNEFGFSKSAVESDREDTVDESKTGLVGTALYVAPEISTASKSIYNQKVDIYSLGVILFEMCYKPLETNMERIKILLGLRTKEIVLPEDFIIKKNSRQEFLIKWLLNHDTAKRPTSQELLQSEHIPPPVLEECELRELVRHTLSNPQLKGYKYLIASCFQQALSAAQDITYDRDPSTPVNTKPLQLYDYVKQKTIKIFKQHGGQNLSTPLLMPKGRQCESLDSSVKLMTHFGSIVTLPHDLRVPFARFIAWNCITTLRRYSIERVYREKKVFGFLPRELYECAFDIVTPTAGTNLMTDAEILYIVYEIINELPGIKNKHFLIRLNHTSLLKAILLYCGIKDKHEEVFKVIAEIKEGKESKYEMQNYFIKLGLSDNSIHMLINFFNTEFDISKVVNYFQMITKKKNGEASQLAKQALQDLRIIAQNAEAFGVTFEIVVAPGLVYNVQQYSGMICQFVCELKKKHKHGNLEVLAAGGRYDCLIASYRNIMHQAIMCGTDAKQSAVGVSISLDKLVHAVQKEREKSDGFPKIDNLDVVVCSVGTKPLLKEKAQILKSLWAVGIKCFLIEATNVEEINEQVNDLKVAHVVMLKDNEQGTVRVRSWASDRFQENKYPVSLLVENMQRILNVWKEGGPENVPLNSGMSRSDSKSSYNERNEHCQEVTVLFVTVEKLSSNARKRYENLIRSQLDGLFKRLNGYIIVLGLGIESSVVNTLSIHLDFESEYQFQKSVQNVIEKHQRHKKYLRDICDEVYDLKNKRTNPIIILYSLSDCFYKILL